MTDDLDHTDVARRPWLYPRQVVNLVESLRIAQLTIDQLRQEVAELTQFITSAIEAEE